MDFSLFTFLFSLKIMHLFDVYPLFDINITKGLGCHVWDDHDTEYLDLYGGHAVISIGHCHPHYVEMLTAQLHKLGFYSNSVINTLQQQFAERLGKACGYDDYQLFLINSGAEANENALKLASFHTGKTRVLSAEKAFHGRTSLAVEATNNPKIIAPINANNHVTFLPLNDLEAWETELAKGDVAACIIECIQGVGGIRLATEEFAKGLQAACKKYGAVLISPEFKPVYGMLGTTFGGNHLACTAALAVLDVIEKEQLVQNAHEVGDYLISQLKEMQKQNSHIVDVRGRGMMIGIELDVPHKEVRSRLIHDEHCFTGCASTNILRLLPPLCLTKNDADEFMEKFKKALG